MLECFAGLWLDFAWPFGNLNPASPRWGQQPGCRRSLRPGADTQWRRLKLTVIAAALISRLRPGTQWPGSVTHCGT